MLLSLHALLASFCVSMISMICVVLIPWMKLEGHDRSASDLASFSAGVMLADAITHQLPHAYAGSKRSGTYCLLGVLSFLFVDEIVTRAFGHRHERLHPSKKGGGSPSEEGVSSSAKTSKEDGKLVHRQAGRKSFPAKGCLPGVDRGDTDGRVATWTTGILNLVADGMHNFTDGLVIGITFASSGVRSGWNTALAMLAHEIPQEVGDYGILLRSGFDPTSALLWNFVSSLFVVLGTWITFFLGTKLDQAGNGMPEMEAFTAGGFIYLSLGHVLPELRHASTGPRNKRYLLGMIMGIYTCSLFHSKGSCCDHGHSHATHVHR